MDFENVVYGDLYTCRAFICREENELSFNCINLPNFR